MKDRPNIRQKPFSVVSLFTGMGGLDLGLEAAGFETRVAVEMDATACATMRRNRDWPVLEGPIDEFSSEEILTAAGLRAGEVDLLAGGPPCQPFSKASYWVRGDALRLDDPRADTLTAYLRVLRDVRPAAFILENVHGLAFKSKDEGLRLLLEGIQQVNREAGTNYQPQWQLLNAADYGVPQLRQRVFLVGARDGSTFSFPRATHRDPSVNIPGREPWITTWDALHDLPESPNEPGLVVGGRWGALLPSIPEGNNYLYHTDRGKGMPLFGWRTRFWSFLLKIGKTQPSWTIQAQPGTAIGPFHWDSRRLTARELCRLQTIPDDVDFECGRTEIQRMIGNAVPSLMGEIMGREIACQLLGAEVEGGLSLMPARAERPAVPARVKAVPKEYMKLVGEHQAHPGTGKGNAAARRSAVGQAELAL